MRTSLSSCLYFFTVSHSFPVRPLSLTVREISVCLRDAATSEMFPSFLHSIICLNAHFTVSLSMCMPFGSEWRQKIPTTASQKEKGRKTKVQIFFSLISVRFSHSQLGCDIDHKQRSSSAWIEGTARRERRSTSFLLHRQCISMHRVSAPCVYVSELCACKKEERKEATKEPTAQEGAPVEWRKESVREITQEERMDVRNEEKR